MIGYNLLYRNSVFAWMKENGLDCKKALKVSLEAKDIKKAKTIARNCLHDLSSSEDVQKVLARFGFSTSFNEEKDIKFLLENF